VNGLIAARPASDRRYALRNNELAVYGLNGNTERRVLTNAAELRATLEGAFRLTLPDAPELDAALERLTTQAGQGG
jgi:arylamine N-acetyltransferase